MKTKLHDDARGFALCVKCYNLTRDVPADAEGTTAQQIRAQESVSSTWWSAADDIAKAHGFREVFSAGRMGGWLYTSPLPEPVTDGDGEEPGEYPDAFVADISALLDRVPEMYADTLAEIIADADGEAEEHAARGALPARLARALHACMPHVDTARKVSGGDGDIAAANARAVLADYLDALLDDEGHRDFSEDEARIVADARMPSGET